MTNPLALPTPPAPLPLKDLKLPLANFIQQEIRELVQPEKVWQYARIRRMSLYMRGLQYLTYGLSSGGNLVDYKPYHAGNLSVTYSEAVEDYDFVLNFLKADVRTFDAVIGSRAPNIKSQARDLGNEEYIRKKVIADRVAAYLRSHWKPEILHPVLVHTLATKGTGFTYVRWTANKARYGQTAEPLLAVVNVPLGEAFYQCPHCGTETPQEMAAGGLEAGAPGPLCQGCGRLMGLEDYVEPESVPILQPTGQFATYENGAVELDICDGSTVTIPFWHRDLTTVPWLVYECERDKGQIVSTHPQLRPYLQGSTIPGSSASPDESGQYTRDLISSPGGYTQINRNRSRWRYTQVFIPPSSYEYLRHDQSGNLRQMLLDQCPDGARTAWVEGELVQVLPMQLQRCWTACKPDQSDSIYCDPYFEDYIQGQDNVNDAVNSITEAAMRTTGLTIFDPGVLDPDRVNQRRFLQGEMLPAKDTIGGDLSRSFFRIPAAEVNSALFNYVEWYITKMREISGITDAIFGGGPPEPTAFAANIKRNQALMKLNQVWNALRACWAQTYENGAYWVAKMTNGQLMLSKGDAASAEAISVEGVDRILGGGWYYECDESMPETVGQRRDFFMQLLANNPMTPQVLGVGDPRNVANLQEAIGATGWVVPGLNERNKLMDIINQLASTPPMPPMMDPYTGMPAGPPMPTIPPDPLLFDPPFALQVVREWLVSDHAREVEEQFPDGVQNVVAYGRAWMQMMAPPPMPPEGEGGKPPTQGGSPPKGGPPTQSGESERGLPAPPVPGGGPPPPGPTPGPSAMGMPPVG